MNTTLACLSVASSQLKEYLKRVQHPLLEAADKELSFAISLMEQHYKLRWSIYWKDSKVWLKKKVKEQLNNLCFDAYTYILLARKSLIQYLKSTRKFQYDRNLWLKNQLLWSKVIQSLNIAYLDLQEEGYRLNQKQLNFHEALICSN